MERIHCPAPLSEEPAGPLLTKMLVLAPYEAPKKEANKKAKETRSGLRHRGASDTKSEDFSDHPPSGEDEKGEVRRRDRMRRKRSSSPLRGGGRKG